MGRRGPAPLPKAVRQLRGNAGKRPLGEAEPEPPKGDVRPPEWLRGKGRWAWRQIAPVLTGMGLLTTADPHALALLCDAYAEFLEAREVVRKKWMTYESRTTFEEEDEEGETKIVVSVMVRARPEVKIASDAWKRIRAMMQEFGLTPSARTRVKGQGEGEADELEAWMKGTPLRAVK
ncbi:MAG: phage terminase small subunit family [Anaerolineales bacterium]|nr:phage terminase small subunit P27 family [Anaerolineales bacterium]MBM2842530.1 phage terminase small subunit family [Anaerolineales bacterium]